MKKMSIISKMTHTITVIGYCLLVIVTAACSDTWDDHYDGAAKGVQEGSLWQAIQQDSELSNFKSVIEACGYDKSLASAQVFTVFAPTNNCFSKEEADKLIAAYNAEKGKVDDNDNSCITTPCLNLATTLS